MTDPAPLTATIPGAGGLGSGFGEGLDAAGADEGDRPGAPTPLHRTLRRFIKAIEATAERRVHE